MSEWKKAGFGGMANDYEGNSDNYDWLIMMKCYWLIDIGVEDRN